MVVEIPFFRSREPVRENERIVRPRVVSGATIPVVLGRGGQGGEQDGRGVGGGRGGGRRSKLQQRCTRRWLQRWSQRWI